MTVWSGRVFSSIVALAFVLFLTTTSRAQTPQERILTAVSDSDIRQLRGNVHPLAQAQFDGGKVDDSTLLPRMTMFFAPSPRQQAALSQLLSEQQDRSSPNYHRWITPGEFGIRFGLSENDLNKVTSWLESRGFTVLEMPASHNAVSFSGSAAQVEAAFHTSIHRYVRNGEEHHANASEPFVPAALAGVVSGFAGLNDFRPKPKTIRRMAAQAQPDFTDGSSDHFLAPGDFAVIYDVTPLYSRGIDGTGQKIAIVGQSDIQLNDLRQFRSLMGLAAKDPQVVLVPGSSNPGMLDGDLQEADLDLEWAGAVAKNATLIYVNSTNAWGSLQYAVMNDLAPVISVSYGGCEPEFSVSDAQSFMLLGEQANVQGQTIVASAGDTGAANCDPLFAPKATLGLAVSIPASLPFATAVGGTEFNEGSGTYWSTANSANNLSALSYIPEISWNDSFAGFGIQATGGGASTLFTKPLWQSGPGVPNDAVRDVPDVSFSASADHDGYLICDETYNSKTKAFTPVCPSGFFGGFDAVGGTSAGAPSFAAIVALLNQSMNSPQGNINYVLYRLAELSSSPFHDISSGNNAVPCQMNPPSPDCPASGSSAGLMGYGAGPGYDMVTGLGSVDVNALIGAWSSVTLPPDFDISVSPPNMTLQRGSIATADIAVETVGGLRGVPSLACNVPAIFLGVTCSIASNGPNIFTLTLTSANNAAQLASTAPIRTGGQTEEPFGTRVAWPAALLAFSYTRDAASYPMAICLLIGGIVICCSARPGARRTAKLVPMFAAACSVAALLIGCAGGTSGGTAQADPVMSVQLTPQSAVLGQNDQQQFAATMANSSSGSFTWSLSPSLGNTGAFSTNSAVNLYTAPSVISKQQMVTLTATSIADPTKRASATIVLLPAEAGAIQVTGNLNGMTHVVAISLKVN